MFVKLTIFAYPNATISSNNSNTTTSVRIPLVDSTVKNNLSHLSFDSNVKHESNNITTSSSRKYYACILIFWSTRTVIRKQYLPHGILHSGAPELIFSWLSWLAVLLVGAYARRRRRRRRRSRATWRPYSKRGWQRHKALVYSVLLWYRTSILWSIDTCQNRVSADQYHVAISRAQVYSLSRSHVF